MDYWVHVMMQGAFQGKYLFDSYEKCKCSSEKQQWKSKMENSMQNNQIKLIVIHYSLLKLLI